MVGEDLAGSVMLAVDTITPVRPHRGALHIDAHSIVFKQIVVNAQRASSLEQDAVRSITRKDIVPQRCIATVLPRGSSS